MIENYSAVFPPDEKRTNEQCVLQFFPSSLFLFSLSMSNPIILSP